MIRAADADVLCAPTASRTTRLAELSIRRRPRRDDAAARVEYNPRFKRFESPRMKFSIFLMPLFLIVMAIARNAGPVKRFRKAGAVGPETARKPATVGVTKHYLMENAVKRGALVSTGDGRYYVNVPVVEKRKKLWIGAAAAIMILFISAAVWFWHPWR
jgi:hypothetical protein